MFKEVENLLAEFTKIGKDYQVLNEAYEDLETKQYDLDEQVDEAKERLQATAEKKLDKTEKVEKQECKCCGTVLNKAVINHAELRELETKLYAEIDAHPSVKRLEAARDKAQDDHSKMDKQIDELADKLYEYESTIRKALEKAVPSKDGCWFTFHTSLV